MLLQAIQQRAQIDWRRPRAYRCAGGAGTGQQPKHQQSKEECDGWPNAGHFAYPLHIQLVFRETLAASVF
jgi:hypothetical protein